jgi:signal transduction histidine kinase
MDNGQLSRRSIRRKIFTFGLFPVIALLILAVVSYRYLSVLGQSAENIMSRHYASIKAAQQARQVLDENRNLALTFMFKGDPKVLAHLELHALSDSLTICQQHVTATDEREIVALLAQHYLHYSEIVSRLTSGASQMLPVEELMLLTTELNGGINRLVEVNEREMERAEQQTRILAARAQRDNVLLLLAAGGLIILLNYSLAHRISQPLQHLITALTKSHKGENRYPKLPVQSDDEIGLLTAEFNLLFQSLANYDQHNATILAAERMKVRRAEEAKSRFIADLSHQLKTPMTSLAMSVNLLYEKRGTLSEEKTALLLETAKEDCGRLANMLNELLNLARLDAMIQPAVLERLEVHKLIHESVKTLEKMAEEKGIHLELAVAPNLPPITVDSRRFPWIITNLVGNSLRYTDRGGKIVITAEWRTGYFHFQCIDNGCGISAENLPYIFDRYSQFAEREKLGTIGLGLAIVKEVISQHGGDIKAESRLGQGTIFTFWIPDHLEGTHAKSPAD